MINMIRGLSDTILAINCFVNSDVSGDMNLNVQDIQPLILYITGQVTLEQLEGLGITFEIMDVNDDGFVDIVDIINIMNAIIGNYNIYLSQRKE